MLANLTKHKLIVGLSLILILGGGYFGYKNLIKKDGKTRYLLKAVEKGTIVVSVSGSGQILTSEQIDIKPNISGEIAEIYIEKGKEVGKGQLIMKIDETDFQKAVRDAQLSLEAANIELEKLLKPPERLALLQAENALILAKDNLAKLKFTQEKNYQKALENKQKAEDNLEKSYEDAFNNILNVFLDLPTIVEGTEDVLSVSAYQNIFDPENRKKIQTLLGNAEDSYNIARKNYDQNFNEYKKVSRYSEKETIERLLEETIETLKLISEAIKNENNVLDFLVDYFSSNNLSLDKKIEDYQSNLKTYTSKINTHLSNLLAIQRTIRDNKEAKLNAERDLKEMDQNYPLDLAQAENTVKEKEETLIKLKSGPDELDVKLKKIALQQKEENLKTAKENLLKCSIKAPFDGIISEVKVKKGDSVSPNTVLATLISKQKIAQISLNEIDAAKVKIGQKATLTFDAIPDLTLTGKVSEIDIAGSISQGVVSFGVKIALDTDDERVKPGMSVTANIIVDSKLDILVVPSSAVKSQEGIYYVELAEIPDEKKEEILNSKAGVILKKPPKRQQVEIGISNDKLTEILSGLKEGDIVVVSTISQTTTQRSQQLRIPGMTPQMRFPR